MSVEKQILHPRNLHRSRYDFPQLINSCPQLEPFVFINPYGDQSIDFSNPKAVKTLNKALLIHFYGLSDWDIPENYLCPPIPGRADYIHYLADLLASVNGNEIPKGNTVKVLDIGVGANCVYPIIGHQAYGWSFVGSDVDKKAISSAENIAAINPPLARDLTFRIQNAPANIFKGIVKPGELFDITLCNPPFHTSAEEAQMGSQRKVRNLGKQKGREVVLNFGGQSSELWCKGGEVEFIRKMIEESAQIAKQCVWFTSLVSKSAHLSTVYYALDKVGVKGVRTVEMAQGQKQSRFVAWTFLSADEQSEWSRKRWKK
ncbi:23S rRNA (adenine1618-N6)-methyltransferase [Pedobacter cryoconitis]|uniref:23S rRNA (adenine(1618)-N(6))-methyltransferase RlmF n=1 Tax=Pedobacter cryoconitis TaxID=188932 RepID=UPI0016094EE7|nr:23S rRNA (adenine(1618)-N(6))-methyltransferase RlmF [Pedobacter cryoconitis]MBB6273191.1 23S rRNA (adenine1618-N6)-methyltransferase [Pedobacter cryoconitis]